MPSSARSRRRFRSSERVGEYKDKDRITFPTSCLLPQPLFLPLEPSPHQPSRHLQPWPYHQRNPLSMSGSSASPIKATTRRAYRESKRSRTSISTSRKERDACSSGPTVVSSIFRFARHQTLWLEPYRIAPFICLAGKSTLLRILAGKKLTKTKTARIMGQDVFMNPPGGVVYLGTEWANNPVIRSDIGVAHFLDSVGGYRHKERRDALLDLLDVDLEW